MLALAVILAANSSIARIESVKLAQKIGENKIRMLITAQSTNRKRVQFIREVSGSDAPRKAYLFDRGRIAIFRFHIMNRMNSLIALQIRNHHLVIDDQEELDQKLFDMLPRKMAKEQVPDNVSIERATKSRLKLDFESRDEHDGIHAEYRISHGKWSLVSAKYWRYKGWNGHRNF